MLRVGTDLRSLQEGVAWFMGKVLDLLAALRLAGMGGIGALARGRDRSCCWDGDARRPDRSCGRGGDTRRSDAAVELLQGRDGGRRPVIDSFGRKDAHALWEGVAHRLELEAG